jgi:hypothetical protein
MFTGSYSQNFNSLASTGTSVHWGNDSTLPGWYLYTWKGTAISTYNAGYGDKSTPTFFSFGSSGSTERALGGLGSTDPYFDSPPSETVAGYMAVAVQNKSGGTYTSFVLQFVGEQWRNNGNPNAQRMQLQYGFGGGTFGSVSTWTAPGGTFDYTSPVHTSTAAAVDGNSAGKVSGLGGTISGISWTADQTLWIRWIEYNDFGSDHALAIDDFSITTPVPEPVNVALGCFAGLVLLGSVWRRIQPSRRLKAQKSVVCGHVVV